jgi:hypothetical protein
MTPTKLAHGSAPAPLENQRPLRSEFEQKATPADIVIGPATGGKRTADAQLVTLLPTFK